MTQTFNRWLPSFTLLFWGVILLYFHQSGRLTSFLHPNFIPGVFITGVVLLGLALAAAFGGGAEACEQETCGHSFARLTSGKALTLAVLFLPLMAILATEDGFSLSTIQNRGVVLDAQGMARNPDNFDLEGYMPEVVDGHYDLSVIDLLYAAQEPSLRADFDGKPVQVIGQLMKATESNPRGNRMKVIRMFMSCCAADAKPVGALIELPTATDIPELSWVKVTGTARFPMEGGRNLAVLEVRSIATTPPPTETMLY